MRVLLSIICVFFAMPLHALTMEEAMDDVQTSLDELAQSGFLDDSIGEGDQMPPFSLPNPQGETITLEQLLQKGPVVLTFYRGGWCPVCNVELRNLQQKLAEIHSRDAELVAISPELPTKAEVTQTENLLEFPVLSDVGNAYAKELGIVFSMPKKMRNAYALYNLDVPQANGDTSYELPIPATFVIHPDGTVVYAFKDVDYRKRAPHEEILAALNQL